MNCNVCNSTFTHYMVFNILSLSIITLTIDLYKPANPNRLETTKYDRERENERKTNVTLNDEIWMAANIPRLYCLFCPVCQVSGVVWTSLWTVWHCSTRLVCSLLISLCITTTLRMQSSSPRVSPTSLPLGQPQSEWTWVTDTGRERGSPQWELSWSSSTRLC